MITFEKIRTPEWIKGHPYKDRPVDEKGDSMIITEKLDGSNAQIINNNGTLEVFSHHTKLDFDNTLNGFYGFIMENAETFKKLPTNYAVFGEWLTPHKIVYKEEAYYTWYLFDVFDRDTNTYLGYDKTVELYKDLFNDVEGVSVVPLLARVNDKSIRDLVKDSTKYGEDSKLSISGVAEGFVVTDTDKLIESKVETKYLREKIVNESFKESRGIKTKKVLSPKQQKFNSLLKIFSYDNITDSRIRKQYFELRDNNKAPEKVTKDLFKGITKIMAEMTLDDAIAEAPSEYKEFIKLLVTPEGNKTEDYTNAFNSVLKQVNRWVGLTIREQKDNK